MKFCDFFLGLAYQLNSAHAFAVAWEIRSHISSGSNSESAEWRDAYKRLDSMDDPHWVHVCPDE